MTLVKTAEIDKKNHNTLIDTFDYIWNAILAFLLLAILSPLSLWIYFKLKESGTQLGIFRQIRVGRDGKNFEILKFRTMFEDANKDGPFICTDYNDQRITPFGKFLRQKKLDEIPQLINVLKGEMSFVGPRPEIPHFHKINCENIPDWKKRITVKPGITGLAQIDPRVSHDPEEKIVLDLEYVKNKSIFYDWYLLFKTGYLWLRGRTL